MCHVMYLLLGVKSPIANSASDFPVHLLLNNLGTTNDQDQDGDVVDDTGQHWAPPQIIMRMRIKLVILHNPGSQVITFVTIHIIRVHWLMQ